MDRIEQHMNAYLDRHESAASEAMDTVGAHEDSPTLKKSPSRITGAPRPISPRVAGYRWRHPRQDTKDVYLCLMQCFQQEIVAIRSLC